MAQERGGGSGGGSNASRTGSSPFYRPNNVGTVPYPARVNSAVPSIFKKPVVAAPRRPKLNGGGGGGGGYGAAPPPRYSSGKTVGSNSTGRISSIAPPPPAPPAPPKPPDINAWLAGDTTYKSQMDASKKALADYLAQMTGQQNTYENDYKKNLLNLGDQEKLGTNELNDDYASRGLSQSGLMLKALADLKTEYDKRESDLATGRSGFLQDLMSGKTNFMSTNSLQQQKYRQDAINRRAAQFGG